MNKVILINKTDGHNKFWSAQIDTATVIVTRSWGRLGTKGSTQSKAFSSLSSAESYIENKKREKLNEGYKTVTSLELHKAEIESAILGTRNKCCANIWVEMIGPRFQLVHSNRLQEPDCQVGLFIILQTQKQYADFNHHYFVFTNDGVLKYPLACNVALTDFLSRVQEMNDEPTQEMLDIYLCWVKKYIVDHTSLSKPGISVQPDDQLYPLIEKVELAITACLNQ